MANSDHTTTPISQLFESPYLRAVFSRAERDNGASFAVPSTPSPTLIGGEAAELEAVGGQ